MPSVTSVLLTLGGVMTAGAIGYMVYFDYKRRNDVEFRRELKRQRKVAAKKKAQEMKGKEEEMVNMLKQALELAKDMKYPTQPEEREKFFMENIQAGELLFRQGPHKVVESAVAFFHAIKIYPNPTDILVLLQKSVPEDVFALVYAMISTEVQINQMMDKQQQH